MQDAKSRREGIGFTNPFRKRMRECRAEYWYVLVAVSNIVTTSFENSVLTLFATSDVDECLPQDVDL